MGQVGTFLRASLPGYERGLRIALFDHKQKPTQKERSLARGMLQHWLEQHKTPAVVVVVPTPNTKKPDDAEDDLTCVAWQALKMPDSMDNMMFTFHQSGQHLICPLPRIDYRTKEMVRWAAAQCLNRAGAIAAGDLKLSEPKRLVTSPDEHCLRLLTAWWMGGKPLAVDIETIEATGLIMAVGLSDGVDAVSIPWDAYRPAGHDKDEPGLGSYELGRAVFFKLSDLLALKGVPRYFHNYTFDVPRMNKVRGLVVGGEVEDTFAAHAIAFPELKHGLQPATASLIPCPAWKSAWHPKGKGYTRDDVEFWTCDPVGLRNYNALDAFYTMKLAEAVMPCVTEQRGGLVEGV